MRKHPCRALLLAAAGVAAASLAAFAATGPRALTPGTEAAVIPAGALSLPRSATTDDSVRCARFSITVYRACLDHALSHSGQVVSCRGHYEDNLSRCRAASR